MARIIVLKIGTIPEQASHKLMYRLDFSALLVLRFRDIEHSYYHRDRDIHCAFPKLLSRADPSCVSRTDEHEREGYLDSPPAESESNCAGIGLRDVSVLI